MSPRKLTDATKKEILKLYRETEATTSTLAERYGVSSSTVSRFLKNSFSSEEYEQLIQKKRLARNPRGLEEEGAAADLSEEAIEVIGFSAAHIAAKDEQAFQQPIAAVEQLTLLMDTSYPPEADNSEETEINGDKPLENANLTEFFVEAIEEEEEDELDEDWDEEEDEDEEDEDEDEEEEELAGSYLGPTIVKTAQLQILPLSAAAFPKTCYLVIDRAAELITRPLKDFAELGKVPPQEIQQRTLPIFESHRIARRFSKRKEKVIKVPDGRLIEKAHAQLEAKGITRLLMDGRIYALE
ncbi:MAG: helix-turn-helix domain-containing protein [Microcystis sp.]|jgi:transposase-like protein|uniref:Transposase n=1 Tax=Microcystis flos-aquae Mf_QC_C_20070823_S10D TaxID=2486236 RepID=A0A552KWS5_9CHRO|nr:MULTISPECIES: transposase [unclassified Microcystis]MCA2815643.1 transposase [Microcystis sp. M085S1]MCA2854277.1 transposase [Microcystis sp. M065S1]MCZ8056494.1 transposase [Microcystis sp. LE19-12.2C]MDJ0550884.1 transposase [Microcystis sp. M49637_WE12]TRT74503.1 MAG: transposase [Microcystis flos-aquae Ma_QC_C_20070823_S18]TRT92555.1 MAG: transposase [Microcystis flos-aquae Ma_QC_C_20070823_S18D]TRV12428.1 MAG: transposase [Microcystis flos-aquae Mf_QC_C_20070823_S10D]TRV28344.1 MAG